MTKLPNPEYVSLLFEALNSPLGYKVATNNPSVLRQRLYAVRKVDPAFEKLSFVISTDKPEEELWIVNRTEVNADAPPQD